MVVNGTSAWYTLFGFFDIESMENVGHKYNHYVGNNFKKNLEHGHLSIVAKVQIIVFSFCDPILRWLCTEMVHHIFLFEFFDVQSMENVCHEYH